MIIFIGSNTIVTIIVTTTANDNTTNMIITG